MPLARLSAASLVVLGLLAACSSASDDAAAPTPAPAPATDDAAGPSPTSDGGGGGVESDACTGICTPSGTPCTIDSECATDYCATVCADPPAGVHGDGRRNAGETDVDCGGPDATKCGLTKVCKASTDCLLDDCVDGVCATPTATDGVRNGGETDVDCGGEGVTEGATTYVAPRCKDDRTCLAGGDCITGACSPAGVCVLPSCKTAETAGIATCGKGEATDADRTHETCCRSLTLPTRTTRRLDRYEITAGRFRTFIDTAGPDLRTWVSTYVAAHPKSVVDGTVSSQLAQLLTLDAGALQFFPSEKHDARGNLVSHLAIGSDPYGGIRGCYNGLGSYGSNTYWQDAADLADYGIAERPIPRSESDQKSMNCAMPIMFMAFCAWDGGEMATLADFYDAWPSSQTYPWGTTDIKRPNYDWCNGSYQTGGFTCQDQASYPGFGNGAGVFYEWPRGYEAANDEEIWIAAPGRFPNDATSKKSTTNSLPWQDLFANVSEYTGDLYAATPTSSDALQKGDYCDFSTSTVPGGTSCTDSKNPGQTGTYFTGIPLVGMNNHYSWEGHTGGRGGKYVATFQYSKFGARCVRPAQ